RISARARRSGRARRLDGGRIRAARALSCAHGEGPVNPRSFRPTNAEDRFPGKTVMRAFLFGLVLSGLIAAPALACGPAVKGATPPIVAELDDHLAKAQVPDADLAKVKDLRARIETLMAEKKIAEARGAQEEVMGILGYRKALMRCGPGSYAWRKVG